MKKSTPFTIYNASAGSGKTFTLVKEYLLLLFASKKPDTYRNILAVTFTNKAVAEMKSRIVESLHAFSQEECPKKYEVMKKMLCEELNLSPDDVKFRARRILKSIIHNYASFEVSTIDGFTHRVLRTFAKDLDLPLNFEVELNTAEILQEAVDKLIAKAGKDKVLTKVLVSFALGKADEDKSWDISRDLFSIAELLTKETNQPFLQLLRNRKLEDFTVLETNLKKEVKRHEENVLRIAEAFFGLLETNGLNEEDFTRKSCPNFFRKLVDGKFDVKFDAGWQANLDSAPLYPKKASAHAQETLDRLQPEIVDLYQGTKQHLTQLEFLKAVQKNITPLSLLSAIQNEIELIKKERSLVLISEFNATIGKSVKDQPAPFIYERLGERYQHYFIDEFQDTSELQWQNLIPLIDHALSSGEAEEDWGSLTLVGDAKQSIYRWRGGKAEQFMALCKEEARPFGQKQCVEILPRNFRSSKQVVDFNNDFFKFSSSCFSNLEHRNLFEETSAQDPVSQEGGYVNLSFIEAENAAEEMEVYPQKVLEIIRDLEQRQVPKSDVCVLTRTAKEGVAIANVLSEEGIPIISYQSLLVKRSPEVQFIIAVLQFALDGTDKNLKLELLEYLLEHQLELEDEYKFLVERLELKEQRFFDSLKPYGINFSLGPVIEKSLYEAVEHIIREFGLVKDSHAYLQFFLDFVYEASQGDHAGLFAFLELWEQKKDNLSIVAPKSREAVQIMTIHKAKGLEFPIVIYPFANGNIEDVARESLWISLPEAVQGNIPIGYLGASQKMKNWGEEAAALYEELCCQSQLDALNVLYVALTRPVQQLYVVSKMELDKKGNESSNKLSGLFISYLKARGIWDGSSEYEFGNRETYEHEEVPEINSFQPEEFFTSPTEANGISIITKAALLWDSKQEKAIEKGHLIHDIFASINNVDDVAPMLERAKENGLFKYEEEEEVRKTVLEVLEHSELKGFFTGESQNYNERDIISGDGSILRPDRLNFNGEKVSILDYKTGSPSSNHHEQVKGYAAVLVEMGYTVEDKLLVYINEAVTVIRV